jgi:hypothetical protein
MMVKLLHTQLTMTRVMLPQHQWCCSIVADNAQLLQPFMYYNAATH